MFRILAIFIECKEILSYGYIMHIPFILDTDCRITILPPQAYNIHTYIYYTRVPKQRVDMSTTC